MSAPPLVITCMRCLHFCYCILVISSCCDFLFSFFPHLIHWCKQTRPCKQTLPDHPDNDPRPRILDNAGCREVKPPKSHNHLGHRKTFSGWHGPKHLRLFYGILTAAFKYPKVSCFVSLKACGTDAEPATASFFACVVNCSRSHRGSRRPVVVPTTNSAKLRTVEPLTISGNPHHSPQL